MTQSEKINKVSAQLYYKQQASPRKPIVNSSLTATTDAATSKKVMASHHNFPLGADSTVMNIDTPRQPDDCGKRANCVKPSANFSKYNLELRNDPKMDASNKPRSSQVDVFTTCKK